MLLAAGLCALAVLSSVASAAAAPVPSLATATTYPLQKVTGGGPVGPLGIGSGGNVWFSQVHEETYVPGGEVHYPSRIAQIDRQGEVKIVADARAEGMALTAGGSVWFTGGFNSVGRVDPDGTVDTVLLPESEKEFISAGGPIVVGSDGNAWFSAYRSPKFGVQGGTVAAIDRVTADGTVTEFPLPGAGGAPTRLALGSDGNVWFTELVEDRVGRIAPSGQITAFPLPRGSRPGNIIAGPDGALWFSEEADGGPLIGRMTTGGEYSTFALGVGKEHSVGSLTAGADGRVWFTLEAGAIHRLSPSGRLSRVQLPSSTAVTQVLAGPEGSIWYAALPGTPCGPGDSTCGQGGSYESRVFGHIQPPPLAVTIDSAESARKGRWVKVRVSCLDGRADYACQGAIRLRAGGVVAARREFELGSDLSRVFSVKLRRKARETLLRRHRLRLVVESNASGAEPAKRTFAIRTPI